MISAQALQEFKEIWETEIGTKISHNEAADEATKLLILFNAVYRPIPKKWLRADKNEYEQKRSVI